MTRSAWVASAKRSPVAPTGGILAGFEVFEVAAPVMKTCLDEVDCPTDLVDEVILGNALYAGGNPARMAVLAAGLPDTVAGLTIDRQCAGGLDAVALAKFLVESGAADVVLAGGAESHSRRPERRARLPAGGDTIAYERPPFAPFPDRDPDLHEAADRLARELGISRDRQDLWSIDSHRKALIASDRLSREIVAPGSGDQARDTFTRVLTMETCRRAPILAGSITRANASVSADAAAFLLVVEERVLPRLRCRNTVRISRAATLGGAPELPGLAPVAAIETVLETSGWKDSDVIVGEVMEAYAAQAIACTDLTGLDPDRVNPGGGSLARGHPIGASGAILAVRLFHELGRASSDGPGLAAIASAGGIGTAVLFSA